MPEIKFNWAELNGVDTPMLKEIRDNLKDLLALALKQGSPSKRDKYEAEIESIEIELESRVQ